MNISHKLHVPALQTECLTFLLTHAAGRPLKAMRIAELFDEEALYSEASRFVLDNPGGWSEDELSTLSPATLLKLEKRRTWFLERVLKLGLVQIAKEYQCVRAYRLLSLVVVYVKLTSLCAASVYRVRTQRTVRACSKRSGSRRTRPCSASGPASHPWSSGTSARSRASARRSPSRTSAARRPQRRSSPPVCLLRLLLPRRRYILTCDILQYSTACSPWACVAAGQTPRLSGRAWLLLRGRQRWALGDISSTARCTTSRRGRSGRASKHDRGYGCFDMTMSCSWLLSMLSRLHMLVFDYLIPLRFLQFALLDNIPCGF